MIGRIPFWRMVKIAVILALFMASFGISPALAARDRTAPTKPTNLRVTAKTAYSVSLAWDPSSDNSGTLSYKIWASYGQTWTVSQTQTSFNWNFGLVPSNSYSFYVYAVDGSGNKSLKSNTVSANLPPDTTPPTAPMLSVTDINPTEVSLQWSASIDDGPYLFYQVFVDGIANVDAGTTRSAVVQGLTPDTSYTLTVKARDLYQNWSAPSNAINVTTDPLSTGDTQPPTSPSDLTGWDQFCGEVWLFWTESFDNQTPQSNIVYEVYVNGILDHTVTGTDRTILYGTIDGENTFTVIARDSAGNHSTPASIIMVLDLC